jgi:threonine/homoserine/homoserine lactone efflux protein
MEFLTVALLHFFAVSSPGPDFVLVTRQSLRSGRRAALLTSLGIGSGILIHSLAAITGLTLIISSQPFLFLCLKILASLYILYLGIMSVLTPSHTFKSSEASVGRFFNSFVIGFLTNVLNPKAIIFFITLFSIILDSSTTRLVLGLYGLYMALATFVWFVMISFIFTNKNLTNRYMSSIPVFEKITGVILILIAIQIFIYELPQIYGQ